MGEGFDFSSLMGMFGGGGAGANFGANVGQPQLTGVFGGTPPVAGGNLMAGQAPEMVPFYGGGQNYAMPTQDYLAGGQGASMPNLGALGGLGGQKQQQQAMPMQAGGGGGGGNTKGLFSSLMQSPHLRQVNPTLGLLGNVMGG